MKYVAAMLSAALVLGLAGMSTQAKADGKNYGNGYSNGYQNRDCYKCPPPRPNYDSTEVLKTTKDVDHSRTIETQSVLPSKRLIETNHLIIRESANSGHANRNHLRLRLGTYRTLHFRECLFARVFVASAIGGARTQHGLSDSRNRFSRHIAKFFLGSSH